MLPERSAAPAAGRVPPAIAGGRLAGFFGRAAAQVIDLIASPRESFASRDHESFKQLIRSPAVPQEPAAAQAGSNQCPGERCGSSMRSSVRHTDAPSGLPRVLSCLGRLSYRNTGSHLNGRHPRPVNAYRTFPTHIRLALPVRT